MAKKWSDVAASPAFQALTTDEQDLARQQYFNDVVAPHVAEDDLGHVRDQFMADAGGYKSVSGGPQHRGILNPGMSTPVPAQPAPSLLSRLGGAGYDPAADDVAPTLSDAEVQAHRDWLSKQSLPSPSDTWASVKAGLARSVAGMRLSAMQETADEDLAAAKTPAEKRALWNNDSFNSLQDAIAQDRATINEISKDENDIAARNQDFTSRNVLNAANSLAQSAPSLAAGILTRSPAVASAAAYPLTQGTSYSQNDQAGVDPETNRRSAALDGFLEGYTELLPAKELFKEGGPLHQRLVNFLMEEIPGESVAQVTQTMNQYLTQLPGDATGKDYIEGLKQGIAGLPDVVASTVMAGGAQAGIVHSASGGHAEPIDDGSAAAEQARADALARWQDSGLTQHTSPSAPGTMNFTPAGSLTKAVGLPDIVVPHITTDIKDLEAKTGMASAPLGEINGATLPTTTQPAGGLDSPSDNTGTGVANSGLAADVNDRPGVDAVQPEPSGGIPRSISGEAAQRPASVAPDNHNAVTPARIWPGRKGGYDAPEHAQQAMPERQRMYPNLDWKVEKMDSGKYMLAGYDKTAPAETSDWQTFHPDTGSLNVPRSDMPQVKSEHHGALVNFLNARGVDSEIQTVPADSLKPTQAEYSPAKVAAMQDYTGDRSILVSSDNHVIDGHHQWMAQQANDEPVKIIRLNAPVAKLMPLVREFPSATTAGETSGNQPDAGAASGQMGVENVGDTGGQPTGQLGTQTAMAVAGDPNQPGVIGGTTEVAGPAENKISGRLGLAKQAPPQALLRAQLQAKQQGISLSVTKTPLTESQRVASVLASLTGNTLTVVHADDGSKNELPNAFVSDMGSRHIFLADNSDDGELFVTAHEITHAMPDHIRNKFVAAIRAVAKPEMRQKFADRFKYNINDDNEIDNEMAAYVAQGAAREKGFWKDIADHLGNKDFAELAKYIIDRLDVFIQKGRGRYGDSFIETYMADPVAARNAVRDAYVEHMREHGLEPDALSSVQTDKADKVAPVKAGETSIDEHAVAVDRAKGMSKDQFNSWVRGRYGKPKAKELTDNGQVDRWYEQAHSQQVGSAKVAEPQEQRTTESIAQTVEPTAPTAEKKSATEKTAKQIEDFGEKILGARKDYAARLKDAMAADIAGVPLSQSWPEPDYIKLLENGTDPWAVAFMHAARDEVPAKPQKGWKLSGWVEQVKTLRDFANRLATGDLSATRARELLSQNRRLVDIADRISLYEAVGHSKSLKGLRLRSGQYSVFNGEKFDTPKVMWSVEANPTNGSSWPRQVAIGATRDEAIANFKKKLIESPDTDAKKSIRFELYMNRADKTVYIGKKIGANIVKLKEGFADVKTARAYLLEHNDDLVRLLEKRKELPYERRDTNAPRVGVDHRDGADVSSDQFHTAFGFRGVQFGNYVEGAKRQADLNQAYDALMDLAGVLNVPAKSLSLNGELGLAFGARGHGGKRAPAAHYEPGQVVINLTKASGAGNLAHEWFHAVDNYFARQTGQKLGYGTTTPGTPAGIRPEMLTAFRGIVSAIRGSDLLERSEKLDETRSRPYWSTVIEMAARAFEANVIAKLQDQSMSNDYLANIVSPEAWDSTAPTEGTYPYPLEAEMPAIRAAFDNFFQTVETKETDKGLALHSNREAANSLGLYSELARKLNDGPNQAPPDQWRAYIKGLAQKGVKGEEVEWSGVNDWLQMQTGKVSKADVLAYVNANGVQVQETQLGGAMRVEQRGRNFAVVTSDGETHAVLSREDEARTIAEEGTRPTKYGQYTLPGGTNYRELLLTLPRNEVTTGDVAGRLFGKPMSALSEDERQQVSDEMRRTHDAKLKDYRSSHWDQPNILAHIRVNDRTDTNGKRVLFVEELQSDWGQQGKKEGFSTGAPLKLTEAEDAELRALQDMPRENKSANQLERQRVLTEKKNASLYPSEVKGVPRAPFVTKTDSWVALALKRVIGVAADEGYDKVAFVTGKQSADRYNLSKQIRSVTLHDNSSDIALPEMDGPFESGTLSALDHSGNTVLSERVDSPDRIAEFIGKDAAQRLLEAKPTAARYTGLVVRQRQISGLQLDVGGEGMKQFYDFIVPKVVKDILRKVGGGEMGEVRFSSSGNRTYADLQELSDEITAQVYGHDTTYDSLPAESQTKIRAMVKARELQQPGFDITPAMRQQVQDVGLPLFSRRDGGTAEPLTDTSSQPTNPESTWASPTQSMLNDVTYKLQDKHVDTRSVIAAINKATGQIADQWDPYLKEEMYHGRTAKGVEDFLHNELRPLLTEMQARGVSMSQLEEYLHNRHAEERNVQIAKVNKDMPDGGSGITTEQAQRYLASLPDARRARLEALARRVDDINAGTRKLLITSGLESQSTIAAWEGAYQHYVPLKREETGFGIDTSSGGNGTGQGFSVRGSASKRATGSSKPVADILANIAMQREAAVVRAEKNRVAMSLYGLAIQNPNPDFWMPVNPEAKNDINKKAAELVRLGLNPADAKNLLEEPKETYIDPKTGLVAHRVSPVIRGANNVLSLRVDGENRYVFFNANDPVSARMATALKNLDAAQLGKVMGVFAKISRYFAAINTQYNPIFGVKNLIRDTGEGTINLSSTPIADKKAEVLAGVMPAIRGIYSSLRAERLGERQPGNHWSQMWEEFQHVGGPTGYRDSFADSTERAKAIQKELDKIAHGRLRELGRAGLDWLSDYNDTLENAVRLSAYSAARGKGISAERAASIAKNLTVNFNRKGEISQQAGALYAFFNASVQGTARVAQTLAGPAGKKIVAGGLLLGVMQAVTLALAGFDDNEPPDFIKQKNLILPTGGKRYISIPYPLGYYVIPNTGRVITEYVLAGGTNAATRITDLLGSYVDSFNPIGTSGFTLQTLLPTALDPLSALAENKDYTGSDIAKQDRTSLAPTPGFTRTRDSASALSKWLARDINALTGGTDYVPGTVSPTPDQLDYLIGQATGGIGREAMKAEQSLQSVYTGEDLPTNKIPLVSNFYGNADNSAAVASKFYNNVLKMNLYKAEIDGETEHDQDPTDYVNSHPGSELADFAEQEYTDIEKLIKERRDMIHNGAGREDVRSISSDITERMRGFNDAVQEAEGGEGRPRTRLRDWAVSQNYNN